MHKVLCLSKGLAKRATIRKNKHRHAILEMAALLLLRTQIRKDLSPMVKGSLKWFPVPGLRRKNAFWFEDDIWIWHGTADSPESLVANSEVFRARSMWKPSLHSDVLSCQKHSFQGKNIGSSVPDPKAHDELDISPNFTKQTAKLQNESLKI